MGEVITSATPSMEEIITTDSSISENLTNNSDITAFNTTSSISTLSLDDAATELPFSTEDSIAFLSSSTGSPASLEVTPMIGTFNTTDIDDFITTTAISNINITSGNGTDSNYYYYDYDNDDYNWYDYNDNDTAPYDYNQGSSVNRSQDLEDIWKNINDPPKILPITYCPKDLNIYFLILPPLFCFAFLTLVFLPCIMLKWRDDIREMMGLQRKYGSNRRFNQRKDKESRERIEEEERRTRRDRRRASNRANDIEYVAYSPSTSSQEQSINSTVTPGNGAKESMEFSANTENGLLVGATAANGDLPIVCTGEEISCIVVDKRNPVGDSLPHDKPHGKSIGKIRDNAALGKSHEASGQDSSVKGEDNVSSGTPSKDRREKDGGTGQDSHDRNFSTSSKSSQPTKFTGWNKDLYSNASGFGPPARRASSPSRDSPPGTSDDPSWGMY